MEVPTDPPTAVFQVEIKTQDSPGAVSLLDGGGVWNETFNTVGLLLVFLSGLKVATVMTARTLDMNEHWEFDPESHIDKLP